MVFYFLLKFKQNTLLSALSDPVLHCLHMSQKKDARIIWVKNFWSVNNISALRNDEKDMLCMYKNT